MNNLYARMGSGAMALAVVAGCASEPDPPSPDEADQVPHQLPELTEQIEMVYTYAGDLYGVDYELTVSFEEPAGGCDLGTREGTEIVPVTLRLSDTHDPDDPFELSEQVQDLAEDPQDPVDWSVGPTYLGAEPVGIEDLLLWESPDGPHSCTDEPDLESHIDSQWHDGEPVEITGYVPGVPEENSEREGVGVRLDLVRNGWALNQGEVETLTLTF